MASGTGAPLGVTALRYVIAAALIGLAAPAAAGPPYQTDDPEPTELGHWEIYNFVDFDGRGGDIEGAAGLDLNYGGAKELQLTATLPLTLDRAAGRALRVARGDVELGAKYRFVHDEARGWQAAIFPRVILPTSARGFGKDHVRILLPLWVQKDFGTTSMFGGGGYEINPGTGNKDFWQAAVAVTRDVSDRLSLGSEVAWRSADTFGGTSSTGVNVGLIRRLSGPYSLLFACGPSFSAEQTAYHAYAALALNF